MSLSTFDLSRDVANSHIESKTAEEVTSLTAAQAHNINAFVVESSMTTMLSNAQGAATITPASAAFRHIANFFFSSTAGTTIPVAHNQASTTSLARVIQVGRTTMDDGIVSGSVTAIIAFNTTGNNTYIDVPETTLTSSLGRKGSLVSQANTANVVGTVFYEFGTLVFHGGTGNPHSLFLTDSTSGFTFGTGATAGKVACTQLSFKSLNVTKRTSYFCRAFNKEFNYTNNPTAIANVALGSITGTLTANPTTYITTVGLYNDGGDLLAVAKVSPPIKKTFAREAILEVRIDY